MEVYNVDLGDKYITFTTDASPESQIGRVLRDECFAIKGADCVMRNIDAVEKQVEKPENKEVNGPTRVGPNPSSDNIDLVSLYNTTVTKHNKANKDKNEEKAKSLIAVYGLLPTSILSDSVITVSFEEAEESFDEEADGFWFGRHDWNGGFYKIKITNKTNENVYVDIANSFRINSKGESSSFLDKRMITHNSNSGGVGVNMGAMTGALGIGGAIGALASGVNVGGGSSSGTTITESQDVVLVIPAGGTIIMPPRLLLNKKGDKVLKNYENFREIGHITGKQYDNKERSLYECLKKLGFEMDRDSYYDLSEILEFQDEKNLYEEIIAGKHKDKILSRIVTYSTDANFSKYTSLQLDVYIRGYIGSNAQHPMYKKFEKNDYCIHAKTE
ncbi:MAG: hypothetical protein NC098_08360 [Lachnoclostridium sp.]|nr:hypothetical protein [Lachnoclostridium sp.]